MLTDVHNIIAVTAMAGSLPGFFLGALIPTEKEVRAKAWLFRYSSKNKVNRAVATQAVFRATVAVILSACFITMIGLCILWFGNVPPPTDRKIISASFLAGVATGKMSRFLWWKWKR